MFPYILLLVAILLMTLFDGKKYDKIIFSLLVVWMFIFAAFRVGGTGTGDYDAYLRLYSLTDTFEKVINPEIHAEIGFRILSFFGNFLGFSGQYIIVVMAFLSIIPVTYVIYKYSPYKILSLLVWMSYFLTMNMHSSRTSVAAAFGLLFLISFAKRNTSILYFIIACLFHYSSFVLIGVFLAKVRLKRFLRISVLSLIIFLLISPFDLLIRFLDLIGIHRLSGFIQIYLESGDYGYKMPIYDPRILLGILVSLLILNIKNSFIKDFEISFYKIFLIGVLLMMVFSDVTIMAWRTSYYFLLIGVILIPLMAEKYNIKFQSSIGVKRLMSFVFVLIYLLYTTPLIMKAEPYEFFLK